MRKAIKSNSITRKIYDEWQFDAISSKFCSKVCGFLLSTSLAVGFAAGSSLAVAATSLSVASNASGQATPGSQSAALYSRWAAGPSQAASFFPIAVAWQSPKATGRYGAYGSLIDAAVGEKMNIFLGLGGAGGGQVSWPEYYGRDNGELEVIKAHGMYVIGGLTTPYVQNTSAQSVSSMLALARSIGATSTLIGYNEGDEPNCSLANAEPTAVAMLQSYDPTRIVAYNHTHWMTAPSFDPCLSADIAGFQSAGTVASADMYPVTDAYLGNSPGFPKSDFLTYPNDTLFMVGLMTQGLVHYATPGQPVWVFVESGSDNLRGSHGANSIASSVTSGSTTLTLNYPWTKFTRLWIGLTLNGPGIPAGTKVASIIDSKHLTMTQAATVTGSKESVYVQGGAVNSDCVLSANICVSQGNQYRATPSQVNAAVWNALISGANGIEYFCDDNASYAFCLGGSNTPAAIAVQQNLTYVNSNVLAFAPMLNSTTVGQCSMQQQDYTTSYHWTTTSSCTGGILTMATVDASVPGLALVKSYNGVTYLVAQSDRRSSYGAYFHFTLAGLGNKTATVVYDSNAHYDPAHSSLGHTIALSAAGYFPDVLGANSDHYQVKIYEIR